MTKLTYIEMKKRFDENHISQVSDKLNDEVDNILTRDLDTLIEMAEKEDLSTIAFLSVDKEKSNLEAEEHYLNLETWKILKENDKLTFEKCQNGMEA